MKELVKTNKVHVLDTERSFWEDFIPVDLPYTFIGRKTFDKKSLKETKEIFEKLAEHCKENNVAVIICDSLNGGTRGI